MEFLELIRKRYSVRAYKSTPVEEEKLHKILEAAILAPTAANKQPFRLIVLKTAGQEAGLRRVYPRDWFVQAPLVICACAVKGESWVRRDGKNYADVDTTIAFDPAAAREVLKLPAELEPIAFTPLGYPADEWKPKKRRPASDLVQSR